MPPSKSSSKRELIHTGTDERYVRSYEKGYFKESTTWDTEDGRTRGGVADDRDDSNIACRQRVWIHQG
jgi:hypothetical protein